MTGHFTQDELLAIIEQSKQDVTNPPVQYKVPDLRSQDFTKMIDHTYLKLDAETEQIDQLCDEARRHDFKVCLEMSEERKIHTLLYINLVRLCAA